MLCNYGLNLSKQYELLKPTAGVADCTCTYPYSSSSTLRVLDLCLELFPPSATMNVKAVNVVLT